MTGTSSRRGTAGPPNRPAGSAGPPRAVAGGALATRALPETSVYGGRFLCQGRGRGGGAVGGPAVPRPPPDLEAGPCGGPWLVTTKSPPFARASPGQKLGTGVASVGGGQEPQLRRGRGGRLRA